MIQVRELGLQQGKFSLQGISFDIPSGAYGILMGKTGSGKTSILEAIAGLRHPTHGSILLGHRDVSRLEPGERGIGYVPQDGALFRTMTVYRQLAFALELRGWGRSSCEERVNELAGWLGITHLLQRKPHGLSGGETQRVALGRALSFKPKYLLLDEPLSSLDEETRETLIELLQGIRKSGEVTVLHITHQSQEAERLGDVVLRVIDGRVVQER
jgi:molybdate/tungstate transport system ATP-binding protein